MTAICINSSNFSKSSEYYACSLLRKEEENKQVNSRRDGESRLHWTQLWNLEEGTQQLFHNSEKKTAAGGLGQVQNSNHHQTSSEFTSFSLHYPPDWTQGSLKSRSGHLHGQRALGEARLRERKGSLNAQGEPGKSPIPLFSFLFCILSFPSPQPIPSY